MNISKIKIVFSITGLCLLVGGLVYAYNESDFNSFIVNVNAEPGDENVLIAELVLPQPGEDVVISTAGDGTAPVEGMPLISMVSGINDPAEGEILGYFDLNNSDEYDNNEGVFRNVGNRITYNSGFEDLSPISGNFNSVPEFFEGSSNIGSYLYLTDDGYLSDTPGEFSLLRLLNGSGSYINDQDSAIFNNNNFVRFVDRYDNYDMGDGEIDFSLHIITDSSGNVDPNLDPAIFKLIIDSGENITNESIVVKSGYVNKLEFVESDNVCVTSTHIYEPESDLWFSVNKVLQAISEADETEPNPGVEQFVFWYDISSNGDCNGFSTGTDVVLLKTNEDLALESYTGTSANIGIDGVQRNENNDGNQAVLTYIDSNYNDGYDCGRGSSCEQIVVQFRFGEGGPETIDYAQEGSFMMEGDFLVNMHRGVDGAGNYLDVGNHYWVNGIKYFDSGIGTINLGSNMDMNNGWYHEDLNEDDRIMFMFYVEDGDLTSNPLFLGELSDLVIVQTIFAGSQLSNIGEVIDGNTPGFRLGVFDNNLAWLDFSGDEELNGPGGDLLLYADVDDLPTYPEREVVFRLAAESAVSFEGDHLTPFTAEYAYFDLCDEGVNPEFHDCVDLDPDGEFSHISPVIRTARASGFYNADRLIGFGIDRSSGDDIQDTDIDFLRIRKPIDDNGYSCSESGQEWVDVTILNNFPILVDFDPDQNGGTLITRSDSEGDRTLCFYVDINENAIDGREWRIRTADGQGFLYSSNNPDFGFESEYADAMTFQMNGQNSRLRIGSEEEATSSGRRGGGSGNQVIADPEMVMNAPIAGSEFNYGDNIELTWSTSNLQLSSTFVDIYFSDNNGENWLKIANSIANNGSFIAESKNYRVTDEGLFKVQVTDLATVIVEAETGAISILSVGDPAEEDEVDGEKVEEEVKDEDNGNGEEMAPQPTQPPPADPDTEEEFNGFRVGDLISPAGRSSVYYVDKGGLLRLFEQEQIFFTHYDDFNDVKIMTLADYNAMMIGPPMIPAPGSVLVKTIASSRVYYLRPVEGESVLSELIWIEDENWAQELFGDDWNQKIIDIDIGLGKYFLWREKRSSEIGLNRGNVMQPRARTSLMGVVR